jgi:DNA-binding MarR family transcriptional regulator
VDSKGRIDRAAFNARVEALKAHPRFGDAKERVCRDVPESRLHAWFRRTLDADTGAFAIGIAIIGMDQLFPEDGASMQMVIAPLEASGFASATRIRALIDQMRHSGVIEIRPHPTDGRRVKLVPTARYLEAQRQWFEAMLGAAGLVFDLPKAARDAARTPALVQRYLKGVMLRHIMDGFTIFDGMPEVEAFMNRRHGYLLLLLIAGQTDRHVEIARAKLAERFQVSPAHIASILADAEKEGWLRRADRGSDVEISPDFAALLSTPGSPASWRSSACGWRRNTVPNRRGGIAVFF